MKMNKPKSAAVQIFFIFFLVLIAIFTGYSYFANSRGEDNARNTCNAIQTGMSVVDAEKIAAQLSANTRLFQTSEDSIRVGFEGAFVEKWFCNIRLTNGRVIETEVKLDN